MKGKEYLQTQVLLIEIGKAIKTIDFDGFLSAIQNAKTMSPFQDPTLYKKAELNLFAIEGFAKSLKDSKEAFEKLFNAVFETVARGDGIDIIRGGMYPHDEGV